MATNRKISFRNEEIYHLFNRSIERKKVFTDQRESERAKNLIKFYRHRKIPIRFSKVRQQSEEIKEKTLRNLYASERVVDIFAYCLMPNHFHFLLKQNSDKGISNFASRFTNAYTKYFNTKHRRIGPLFEGIFKAVHIEDEDQLIHVSRYIHINPVVSSIIAEDQLPDYPWSSYQEYLSLSPDDIVQKDLILNMFKSIEHYKKFVTDQVDYGKRLEAIKHLILE